MRMLCLLVVLVVANAIGVHQCDRAACKTVLGDCTKEEVCFAQLKTCLKTLKGNMDSAKGDSEKHSNSLDDFDKCMGKHVSTGKVWGCAQNNCPTNVAEFISVLYNQVQTVSFIGISFDQH